MSSTLLRRAALLLAGFLAAAASPLSAISHITVVNTNAAGVGFNDPTAASPVGGNAGTTVGQQRLNAFQYAADLWAALLTSDVEIRIQASFVPLSCAATSGVLGSAGPINVVSDFTPGAQFAGTWYPIALANKRAGRALIAGSDDIRARFNSEVGKTGCLEATSWYYGLDNKAAAAQIDLVNTLLHEFGHGLGFLTLVDPTSGQQLMGDPDVFERWILDTTGGGPWVGMSDAQRAASAKNALRLAWNGPNVTAAAPGTLTPGTPILAVNSPAAIAGELNIGTASFGPAIGAAVISGPLVQALDAADVGRADDVRRLLAADQRGGHRGEDRVRRSRHLHVRREDEERAERGRARPDRHRQRGRQPASGTRRNRRDDHDPDGSDHEGRRRPDQGEPRRGRLRDAPARSDAPGGRGLEGASPPLRHRPRSSRDPRSAIVIRAPLPIS